MSFESLPRVTKDPKVRLPSTWRDAIGAPLTDSMIRKYSKQGRYGEEYIPKKKEKHDKQKKNAKKPKPSRAVEEDFI